MQWAWTYTSYPRSFGCSTLRAILPCFGALVDVVAPARVLNETVGDLYAPPRELTGVETALFRSQDANVLALLGVNTTALSFHAGMHLSADKSDGFY